MGSGNSMRSSSLTTCILTFTALCLKLSSPKTWRHEHDYYLLRSTVLSLFHIITDVNALAHGNDSKPKSEILPQMPLHLPAHL